MLIGILQCGHFPIEAGYPERTYTDLYASMLAGHGFAFRTWSVVDMDFPATVREADGWLVTGSRHGAYEDLPFIPPLEDFIRAAFDAPVPLVGVCFGHQIIAQALGGRVEKFAGGWLVGRTDYDFGDEVIRLNAWHQDQVVEAPPAARTVATALNCAHAALVYDDRAFSVQPHPEFDDEALRLLIEARARGVVPDRLIRDAEAELGTPVANAAMGDRIAGFFKEAARG